jgi:general secretion pathway protein D
VGDGLSCKNFLLDPRVVATGRKVSIITPNKMSPAEAYRVFLAALATVGLTVVPAGNALRVVEGQAARRAALPIHVYQLGSAIAEELAKTLMAAIGDGRTAKPATGAPPAPSTSTSPPTTPGGPLDNLGTAIEGQVRVIADPPTNSLIVMSSGRDFFAIKDVIKQLDLPRRQVYIEAMILEVDAGNDNTLGTVSHGGTELGSGALLLGGVRTEDVKSTSVLQLLGGATGLIGGLIGKTLEKSQSLLGQSIPSFTHPRGVEAGSVDIHPTTEP